MDFIILFYQGKYWYNFYAAYFDGISWKGNKKIGSILSNPGAIFYKKSIHLLFVGDFVDNDAYNLYEMIYKGGDYWSQKEQVAGTARSNPDNGNCGPKIVLLGDELFTAYKGYGTDLRIAWTKNGTWTGDITFVNQDGVTPKSNMDPAIVIFKNNVYMFYKGHKSNTIYWIWQTVNDAFQAYNWYGNFPITVGGTSLQSDRTPAAVVYDDKLYLFYKNPDTKQIYYCYYDGEKWSGNLTVGHDKKDFDPQTDDSPSAIVYNDLLYLFYRGKSNEYIYSAVFDKQSWSGNEAIKVDLEEIQSLYVPGVTLATVVPVDRSSWMLNIPDDTLISNINLLGTHDSAAINSFSSTPYACQDCSITDQLKYGVRVLDVRLAVNEVGDTITFDTCHGDTGPNRYQTFDSLLDECQDFLTTHPSECIVMMLKFDDPNDLGGVVAVEQHRIELALTQILSQEETESNPPHDRTNLFAKQSGIPKLKDVRGKIYLYNRIIQTPPADIQLGTYVHWTDNTQGTIAQCVQDVYVQDWYKVGLYGGTIPKLTAIEQAFLRKKPINVVLNFASAIDSANLEIMNNGNLLSFFGEEPASERLTQFGWTMFDFPFTPYYTSRYSWVTIADIIIQSNFGYMGYEDKFSVLYSGHPEL